MIKIICLSVLLAVVAANSVLEKSQKDEEQARYVHENVLRERFLDQCAQQKRAARNECLNIYKDTVECDTVSRKRKLL